MTQDTAIERYSGGLYLKENPDWHIEDTAWKANHIARMVDSNKLTFASCIEVGCGAGYILKYLSEKYRSARFTGYDISPQLRPFWDNVVDDRITFHRCNFCESTEKYDLLLLIDVFEHVEDYLGFLRSLSTRAKYFVFHIPLDMNVQLLLRDRHAHFRDTIGHLHYFSKSSAIRTLEDAGYEIKNWFYTASSQEAGLSKRSIKSNALNIVRRFLFRACPDLVVKSLGGYSIMVLAVNKTH